jgi:hypothetical protein
MSDKNSTNDLTTIKIGTRVRHSSDGATGQLVWANATTVKIQWDDGEKVTWKRAELAAKGLEVLNEDVPQERVEVETSVEPAMSATEVEASIAPETLQTDDEPSSPTATTETAEPPQHPDVEATAPADGPVAEPAVTPEPAASHPAVAPAKKKRTRPTNAAASDKLSAIDAAAKVLEEEHRPMGCKELIGAMAAKGYWTSPGGKTPGATLYSAILREVETKGDAARFVKAGRGLFTRRSQA